MSTIERSPDGGLAEWIEVIEDNPEDGVLLCLLLELRRRRVNDAEKDKRIAELSSPGECGWRYDENDYFWSSSCGEDWQFTVDGPVENRVKFCQGCGKQVRIIEGNKDE
ncbi:hypothetical protein [Erwinia phyllosphaerae]|uniref:hypothetical protein n=1 Tax=Erwinia phyllosphaerae TaxID=2853256 RepID=UPI001FEE8B24|nr:hypothetical protein [Erwinia phyllosphaerae]MBV4365872.1 hypothetical protein [Erwinia phyllosphaerae]